VKRAIVWMKRHAAAFGVSPDRVVLGGDSAGAHRALLAASAPDDPWLTPEDVRGENLSTRGVITYYAVADYRLESKPLVNRGPVAHAAQRLLTGLLETWSGPTIPSEDVWSAQFVGGQREDWPDLYRRVSPITRVRPDSPPTLHFVGEHDVYVSRGRSILALHHRLQAGGVPSMYVELPQTDHAFDMVLPTLSPAAQAAMYDVDDLEELAVLGLRLARLDATAVPSSRASMAPPAAPAVLQARRRPPVTWSCGPTSIT
jgi:acetyl esterase/lipase